MARRRYGNGDADHPYAMDPMTTDALVDLPKLLGLAIALVGGVLAASSWWKRHRSSALVGMQRSAPQPAGDVGRIVYDDAPTVRVVDSDRVDPPPQRLDRLRKIVRIRVGEFVDILPNQCGPIARFRIKLKAILVDSDAPAARIAVEYGGTALSCGPLVQELGCNDFVLPRTTRDDPRTAVVYFQERGNVLDFMRIKVRDVDRPSASAELDVMQVSGNWPGA